MAEGGDMFSLEDEDCSQLFITQEPTQKLAEMISDSFEKMEICDKPTFFRLPVDDFASPPVSIMNINQNKYSDISDVEDFENAPVKQPESG